MFTENLAIGVVCIHEVITPTDIDTMKVYISNFEYRVSHNQLGSLNYFPLNIKDMIGSDDPESISVVKIFLRVLTILNKRNLGYHPEDSVSCLWLLQGDAIAAHTDSYHAIHAILPLSTRLWYRGVMRIGSFEPRYYGTTHSR